MTAIVQTNRYLYTKRRYTKTTKTTTTSVFFTTTYFKTILAVVTTYLLLIKLPTDVFLPITCTKTNQGNSCGPTYSPPMILPSRFGIPHPEITTVALKTNPVFCVGQLTAVAGIEEETEETLAVWRFVGSCCVNCVQDC